MLNYILLIQLQSKQDYPSAKASSLVENIYCWLLKSDDEVHHHLKCIVIKIFDFHHGN